MTAVAPLEVNFFRSISMITRILTTCSSFPSCSKISLTDPASTLKLERRPDAKAVYRIVKIEHKVSGLPKQPSGAENQNGNDNQSHSSKHKAADHGRADFWFMILLSLSGPSRAILTPSVIQTQSRDAKKHGPWDSNNGPKVPSDDRWPSWSWFQDPGTRYCSRW